MQARLAIYRGRHPWQRGLLVVGVLFAVLMMMLASVVPFSSDTARRKVIAVLSERMDAEVDLPTLDIRLLPRLHAEGSSLTIRHKGRRDVPPLISIRHFSADGQVWGLLRQHVSRLVVEGLDIEIPPDRNREIDDAKAASSPASRDARRNTGRSLVIDELVSEDGRLAIIPAEPDRDPKVWAIHHLQMTSVSLSAAMPFQATLTNAVPPGEIDTRGHFGPWNGESPGHTPLDGQFTFNRADLSVFKGISGILSAHGAFGGTLARIDIHGETDTPHFTVTAVGHPVPLHTKYHAIVDGTNGNTRLEEVDGSFLNTRLVARGGVSGSPGTHGRTVTLDITMDRARLEDVLKMAVKTPTAPMSGALRLKAKLVLPPGDVDVVRKLELDGQFAIADTRFTDADVQAKINELSHRSRGQDPSAPTQRVASQFHGTFTLRTGTLAIPVVAFDVPGSVIRLAGTYDLVPETFNFAGTLFMDAKISETTTGFKSLLLKVADPLFRKDGGGSAIPIKISGNRSAPSFGLDKGRIFRKQ